MYVSIPIRDLMNLNLNYRQPIDLQRRVSIPIRDLMNLNPTKKYPYGSKGISFQSLLGI